MGNSQTLYVILTANAASYRAAMRGAGRETREFAGDVDHASGSTRRLSDEFNSMSGRLGLLVDTLTLIGPALVPITAVAVPGAMALTNGLTLAAAAAGTVLVAIQGVGPAVKALNDYALEPTAANLEKVHTAMATLSPDARRFSVDLFNMRDEWLDLQHAAANGFLPGADDALKSLIRDVPVVRRGLHEMGLVVGDLTQQAAGDLTPERAKSIVDWLTSNSRPVLTSLLRITENLGLSAGHIIQAFTPEGNQGLEWLVHATGALRDATDNMEETQTFKDFIDYVDTNGPKVADTLFALADASVQIIQAIAPLGGPSLDGIRILANLIATIADSPIGTPLLQGYAAITLLNRGMTITAGLMTKLGLGGGAPVAATRGGIGTAIRNQVTGASGAVRTLTSDLRTMGTEYQKQSRVVTSPAARSLFSANPLGDPSKYRQSIDQETKRLGTLRSTAMSMLSGTSEASARTRAQLTESARGIGKAGALIGGVLLATNDDIGLTNTAMLGLAGSMAGPIGAGFGAAVGFTMDLAAANNTLVDSIHNVDSAYNGSGFTVDLKSQQAALAGLEQQTADYQAAIEDAWSPGGSHNPIDLTRQGLTALGDVFTQTGDDAEDAAARSREASTLMLVALTRIAKGLGSDGDVTKNFYSDNRLQQIADRAAPAMQALNITVDDLRAAAKAGDGSLNGLVDQIVHYINQADKAQGSSKGVADAIAGLGDDAQTTEGRLAALQSALDGVFDPKIGLSAARDAWKKGLNDLKGNLASTTKTLDGNSNAAIQNRGVIRDQVQSLKDLIMAEAKAGGSPKEMTANLKQQRQALMDAGQAAGISKKDMEQYLDTLGLTPKFVKTAIETVGLPHAIAGVNNLKGLLMGLDGRVFSSVIRVTREGPSLRSTGGRTVSDAEGGFRYGYGRYMDEGGWGRGGYYPREPMIARGGSNVTWAEPSTGWEAYISGKPGARGRNLAVLSEAARRLGVRSYETGPGRHSVTVVRQQMPDRMELVLDDGTRLSAYVRGHADQVVKARVDSAEFSATDQGRMRWGE